MTKAACGGFPQAALLFPGMASQRGRRITRHHRLRSQSTIRIEKSVARTSFVSAPIEIRSTPVEAISRTVSAFTPPDTSSTARPASHTHRLAHHLEAEVVEQHRFRAMRERRVELGERLDLDLHGHARLQREGRVERLADPARRGDVVLLDQDAVVQRQALVRAAADAHRVLLREPQARQRLARVEDARAMAVDQRRRSGAWRWPRPKATAGSSGHCARPSAASAPGPRVRRRWCRRASDRLRDRTS